MAAGSGDNLYGEWSQTTFEMNGTKITIETDLSEEKFLRKLQRSGFAITPGAVDEEVH